MNYIIVILVISSFWILWLVVHQALFENYRRQVEDACGAGVRCRFDVVEGDAREPPAQPQQIYDGVIRVSEVWLVRHGVPKRSLTGRT